MSIKSSHTILKPIDDDYLKLCITLESYDGNKNYGKEGKEEWQVTFDSNKDTCQLQRIVPNTTRLESENMLKDTVTSSTEFQNWQNGVKGYRTTFNPRIGPWATELESKFRDHAIERLESES
ncbi:uncharacterized protein I206_105170 [Kwoniella pini CBS 10737]|uniref:Uncharacterized protein n=1 Tax=Kwoniella pini CBS 10737 TaxID=1296096 RepID=A0A1B9I4Z0_9TREE|nr:uncharacterized protein I206_03920 [Kwoniella pini CBS 10737]OCF50595.1 hypothetical protein I206_03920 [Kwoniella pini CBS 10737]